MTESLLGKCYVVTGASSGLGQAAARELAASGADLILLGRNTARLRSTLKGIDAPGKILTLTVDLSRQSELIRCIGRIRSTCSCLDGIVHSAGEFSNAGLLEAAPRDLRRLSAVNVEAAMILSLRLMGPLRAGRGTVLFLNSSIIQRVATDAPYYAATKHALRSLANSLRAEVCGFGVGVVSLFLGRAATPMQRSIARRSGKDYLPDTYMQPADIAVLIRMLLTLPPSLEITDLYLRPARLSSAAAGGE